MSDYLATDKQKRYMAHLLFKLKSDDNGLFPFFLPEITKQFKIVGCENLENWQNLTKDQASSIIDFLIKLPDNKGDTVNLIFSLLGYEENRQEKCSQAISGY